MAPADPDRWPALVAAVQWALAVGFAVDSAVELLRGYPGLTTANVGVLPPSDQWLYLSFGAALVGGVAGYRWLSEGLGSRSVAAHRRRVRFVLAFVVAALAGSLGLVVVAVWVAPLGTMQWLVVGAVFDLAPLVVAAVVGYRAEWLPTPATPAGL